MKSTVRIAAALVVIALGVALSSSPLAAREMQELSGSALRVVSRLSEPGALLVLGTMLAGLSHALRRRNTSD